MEIDIKYTILNLDAHFDQFKELFKGKILPEIHPETVRVRLIAKEIIQALERGLKQQNGNADESLMGGNEEDIKSNNEDDILDGKWVQQTRKKAQERGSKPETSHLDGFNCEVLLINEPAVNAFCLPGGKIVVFTGLFDHFKTEIVVFTGLFDHFKTEIATIIAHEVGHAVARHQAEKLTENLWFEILHRVLYQFVTRQLVNTMSNLLLRLPFSRRMEIEADYIGLLLMASAGYDPRVAPRVYEKLGNVTSGSVLVTDHLSTHPSGKKRAKLLPEAKVMEEALAIYRSGKGIQGFFL